MRMRARSVRQKTGGQALVEFALSITIFLMLLLGIFWFGLQFFRLYALYSASEAGVREVSTLGGDPGGVAGAQACASPQGDATTFVCDHLQDWLGETAKDVEVVVLDASDVPVTSVSYNELAQVRTTLPVSFNIVGREFAFDLTATRVKRVEREQP